MENTARGIWLPKKLMGQRVRGLREGVLRMSQAVLGAALGYSPDSAQGTLAQIESGARAIPDEKLLRLARMADVPLSYFMEEGVSKDGWKDGYLAAVEQIQGVLVTMRSNTTGAPVMAEPSASSVRAARVAQGGQRARRAGGR